MRKNKLLKLSAIILSLSVTACNGFNGFPGFDGFPGSGNKPFTKPEEDEPNDDVDTNYIYEFDEYSHWHVDQHGNQIDEKEEHNLKSYALDDYREEQYCTKCYFSKEVVVHEYTINPLTGLEEVLNRVEPTCTEDGYYTKYCKLHNTVEKFSINKLGHDLQEDKANYSPGNCRTPSTVTYVCKRCQYREYNSGYFGDHSYIDPLTGERNINWTVAPSCGVKGEGVLYCEYCGYTEKVAEYYDHNYIKLGSTSTAIVETELMFLKCDKCGFEKAAFTVEDLTEFSKKTLIFDSDGGAKYYGHTIGNDLIFDTNGLVTSYNPPVFDPNITGDYFEAYFYLTKEQADKYSDCYLYARVKPADYMGANKQDFFLNDGMLDWYQGLYIEDHGDYKAGDEITDSRYLLYVDGDLVDFDQTILNPIEDKHFYDLPVRDVMVPYRFNLHEGYNKIKLVMAGGYISTFYNFYFAPYSLYEIHERDRSHSFGNENTVEGNSTSVGYSIETCGCGATKITIDAGSDLNGRLKRGGKIQKGHDGTYQTSIPAIYSFDMASNLVGNLYVYGGVDNIGNVDLSFYSGKNGGSVLEVLPNGDTNTVFTLNEEVITPTMETYRKNSGVTDELRYSPNGDHTNAGLFKVGEATLLTGRNDLMIKVNNSYALKYIDFVFIGLPISL